MDTAVLEQRDATIFGLRELVSRNPEAAKPAGTRILARAADAQTAHDERLEQDSTARIQAVGLALEIASGRAERPAPPDGKNKDVFAFAQLTHEYGCLCDYVKLFRSIGDDLPRLSRLPHIDAYIEAWTINGMRYDREHPGERERPDPVRDEEYWRADALCLLGIGSREDLLGAFLAKEVARIADEPEERLRTVGDWWEVVVATLLAEDMDTPAEALGIDASLRSGDWYRVSEGSLFDHREGIRAFAGMDPEHGDERSLERRERLWVLATRAVRYLRDRQDPGAPSSGPPRMPRPVAEIEAQLGDMHPDWKALTLARVYATGFMTMDRNEWFHRYATKPGFAMMVEINSQLGFLDGADWGENPGAEARASKAVKYLLEYAVQLRRMHPELPRVPALSPSGSARMTLVQLAEWADEASKTELSSARVENPALAYLLHKSREQALDLPTSPESEVDTQATDALGDSQRPESEGDTYLEAKEAPLPVPEDRGNGADTAAGESPWRAHRSGGLPLRGWDEICIELKTINTRSRRGYLRRANERAGGPIRWTGKRPEVDRGELRAWIEGIELRIAEEAKSGDGAKDELDERGGLRAADLNFTIKKRPNARGSM